MPESLLTIEQVSERLHLSIRTIHGLCREGKLGYVQVRARERLFLPEQVDDFIKSCTIEPPKPIDRNTTQRLPSLQKGGDSRGCGDSAKALRKEMRSWQ
jgi:excisionase family DNA binding protein